DGGGDVGHDAQGEDGESLQVSAAEQVVEAEQPAALRFDGSLQLFGVYAGRGNVRTQAVNRQHRQREQHALAKIRYTKNICQFLNLLIHFFLVFFSPLGSSGLASAGVTPPITSALPPALVIFSCADLENLCACTFNAAFNSPSPRILIRSFLPARPLFTSTSGVIFFSPKAARRSRLTIWYSVRKMLVKPRLGKRRCSGIWPPSKPRRRREPERDPCPLWPRV